MIDWRLDPSTRVEPLHIDVWISEVNRLHTDLARVQGEKATSHVVRRAFYLAQLTPDPLWLLFGSRWTEPEFERCLERGDVNSCLDNLTNPGLEATMTKPDRGFEATVRAIDLGVSGHSTASNQITAFLGAWLDCALAIHASLVEPVAVSDLDQRILLSEPHRRSSEH